MFDRIVLKPSPEGYTATLIDIKTTSEFGGLFQNGYFDPYNYISQLAFYTIAMSMSEDYKHVDDVEFRIICIDPTNEVFVYDIGRQLIIEAAEEIKSTMEELWWHWKFNTWDHRKEYYDNNGLEKITSLKKETCTHTN